MPDHTRHHWRDALVLTRDYAEVGEKPALYRQVAEGRLVRLLTGVYLPASVWHPLTPDERFLARIDAVHRRHPDSAVFAHRAAAAIWSLPAIDPWPERVEVATDDRRGGRSRPEIQRRSGPDLATTAMVDDLPVTSLPRTVIDNARRLSFPVAVTIADAALAQRRKDLPHCTRAELDRELQLAGTSRGHARAGPVLAFADGQSESPGESVSRCAIAALGFPTPVLQHEFRDRHGFVARVDFWWPDHGLVGEFDGVAKYIRDSDSTGGSVAEVVLAEKRRESRLRDLGPRMARWGWTDAMVPRRLEAILRAAGLPQRPTQGPREVTRAVRRPAAE